VGGRTFAVAALIAVASQSPFGQQQPAQQPTFTSGVALVSVDAIVVDNDGHPVKGLKPDDFSVTLDGQVRPVRLLDYREYGHIPATEARSGLDVTNQPEAAGGQSRGGRMVIIVFDDLSFKAGRGKSLLTAVEHTLPSFDTDDMIGIATTSGLGPVVNPTRDRRALIAALRDPRMIGRDNDGAAPFEVTEQEALDIRRDFPRDTLQKVVTRECQGPVGPDGSPSDKAPCPSQVGYAAVALGEMTLRRTTQQLIAYREIIATLAHAPDTPRVIIALTRGIALGLDSTEYADTLDQLSRAAADSKVQFYALSEAPDGVHLLSHLLPQDLSAAAEFMNNGAQVVANAAGGEAFLVAGTADRFLTRIESETSGIYRIGVEVPTASSKVRYLKTAVRVRRPGVTVRVSRDSVLPLESPAPADPEIDLRTRLADGGTAMGVPLTVSTEMRRDPTNAERVEIRVSAAAPASVKGPVEMMYGLVDEAGQMVVSGQNRLAEVSGRDYRLLFPIRTRMGHYRLRVVASDGDRHIGSLETPVSASLPQVGGYATSDLLTAVLEPDGATKPVGPDAIPGDAQSLIVQLELYPAASADPPIPHVQFQLLRADGSNATDVDDVVSSMSGTVLVARTSLPIQALASGSYTIRATVFENDNNIGVASLVVRKSTR
jgi:VWFA-related protein